jgi:hypothetical protein
VGQTYIAAKEHHRCARASRTLGALLALLEMHEAVLAPPACHSSNGGSSARDTAQGRCSSCSVGDETSV